MSRQGKFSQPLAMVISALLPGAVFAQQAATGSAADNSASEAMLQEVTVTATRVEANIEKVPLSIEAMTSADLEIHNVQSVRDVSASMPNLNIGGTAGGGTDAPVISIRGIPGAGLFIDGIYQFSNFYVADLGTSDLLELDRVEVLRGPQGTLFGRDTTSGAIRLFTKPPADTFGVRVSATTGSYDRRDFSLNADIPITSTLFSKLTVGVADQDGYIRSVTVNRAYGGIDNNEIRLDFLWKPVDSFDARLTGFRRGVTGTQASYTGLILDSSPPGTPIVPGFGWQVPNHEFYRLIGQPALDCQHNVPECPGGQLKDLETTANFMGPGILATTYGVNFSANWRITDTINLNSLSSYFDQTSWGYENFSNSDIPFFSQGSYDWQHAWSQEFQLTGNEGPFHWLGGAYAWHNATIDRFMRWAFWNFAQPLNPTAPLNFSQVTSTPECQAWVPTSGLIPCVQQPASQDSFTGVSDEGWSVFGQFGFDITKTLTATVGARYHHQKNSNWNETEGPGTAPMSLIPGELPANTGALLRSYGRTDELSFVFTKPTFRVALNNQFTPDVMGYFNFSQGYNSGGDNRTPLPETNPATGQPYFLDQKFGPETINDYEVGIKSNWFNHRLQINADYFIMAWQNIQVQGTVYDPYTHIELPQYLTQNEASARVSGVEFDTQALITPDLLFTFSMGTDDSRYTRVNPGSEISLDSHFGQAPKLQYSAGFQWTSPAVSNYHVVLNAFDSYTSGFDRTYIPGDQEQTYIGRYDQPAYSLVTARLTLSPVSDNRWQLSVFGTNLTDRRYSTGGFFSPLLQVDDETLGAPREIGATIKFNLH